MVSRFARWPICGYPLASGCRSSAEGGFAIDLLARLGDAFGYDDIESAPAQVEGVQVELATPRMLYRMKRDTVRPQDRADAERLRAMFNLEEE